MKLALITYAFYESTLPLFKYLSDVCDVDLYCLFNTRFLDPPSFDISDHKLSGNGENLKILSNEIIPEALKEYLGKKSNKMNLFLYKPTMANILFGNNSLGKIIKQKKYDCIHFINLSPNYLPILKANRKSSRIICSLHESNIDRAPIKSLGIKNIIKSIQQKKARKCIDYFDYYTFFSENEREKFVEKNSNYRHNSSVIKFGLFETFRYFEADNELSTKYKGNYYLYLGYIRPYKGVDFLLDAIKRNAELNDFRFIIAGKDDMGITKANDCKNVSFINKFLQDSEIVALVKNAKALILPYQNASQSGLPNVAFCFNKPIIFSDVKGLNEYVTNNYNGISFKVNNDRELIEAILRIEDEKTYEELLFNISNKPFEEDLDWNKLAEKYCQIYKSEFLK
jgi:glycosyltransferase involved in cell wall biosynthesis